MKRISAYDEKGKVITSLTQWDSDRYFYIKNYNFETIPDCHYETNKLNEALIVKGKLTENGEQIKFDIPNSLLCHKEKITAYIYQNSDEKEITESKTVYIVSFDILKRIKPSNYVYTATEAFNYHQLSNKVDSLANAIENGICNQNGNGTVTYEIPNQFFATDFFAFDREHATDPNTTGINFYIPYATISLAELKIDVESLEKDENEGIIEQPEDFNSWSFEEQLKWFETVYEPYLSLLQNPWYPRPIHSWFWYAMKNTQTLPLQQVFVNDIKTQITICRQNTEEETVIVAQPNLISNNNAGFSNFFYPTIIVSFVDEGNVQTFKFELMLIGNCPKYSSDNKYVTSDDTIKEVTLTFIPNNTFVEANKNESIQNK